MYTVYIEGKYHSFEHFDTIQQVREYVRTLYQQQREYSHTVIDHFRLPLARECQYAPFTALIYRDTISGTVRVKVYASHLWPVSRSWLNKRRAQTIEASRRKNPEILARVRELLKNPYLSSCAVVEGEYILVPNNTETGYLWVTDVTYKP